jgi:hypothetical protein
MCARVCETLFSYDQNKKGVVPPLFYVHPVTNGVQINCQNFIGYSLSERDIRAPRTVDKK